MTAADRGGRHSQGDRGSRGRRDRAGRSSRCRHLPHAGRLGSDMRWSATRERSPQTFAQGRVRAARPRVRRPPRPAGGRTTGPHADAGLHRRGPRRTPRPARRGACWRSSTSPAGAAAAGPGRRAAGEVGDGLPPGPAVRRRAPQRRAAGEAAAAGRRGGVRGAVRPGRRPRRRAGVPAVQRGAGPADRVAGGPRRRGPNAARWSTPGTGPGPALTPERARRVPAAPDRRCAAVRRRASSRSTPLRPSRCTTGCRPGRGTATWSACSGRCGRRACDAPRLRSR